MPITNRDEALKELEEMKQRILCLEGEKREIEDSIRSLEDYVAKLEERWSIGFYEG